jgi:hypothetical protein
MASILLLRPPAFTRFGAARPLPMEPDSEPAAAARGILCALAASTLFWIGLAFAVPLIW